MKFTAQIMLKELRNNHTQVLELFKVNAKDRKYQVWERNALSVSLFSRKVFLQKLDYIHNNPCLPAGRLFAPAYAAYLKNISIHQHHFTLMVTGAGIF